MLAIKEMLTQQPKPRLVLNDEVPLAVAVQETGRCRQTLVKYITQGRMRGRKVGGQWWVHLDSLRTVQRTN